MNALERQVIEGDDRLWKRQTIANIPENARFATWDTIDIDRDNELEVKLLRGWRPSDGSIWIEGEVGSGKTTLAAAIANEYLGLPFTMSEVLVKDGDVVRVAEKGVFTPLMPRSSAAGRLMVMPSKRWSFLFVEEPQFYSQARAFERWGRRTGHQDPLTAACDASVLILDDLGKICDGKRDLDIFQFLLTRRYTANKPIIFTTNLSWDQVSSVFDASIESRLYPMCKGRTFTLRGRDRRKWT